MPLDLHRQSDNLRKYVCPDCGSGALANILGQPCLDELVNGISTCAMYCDRHDIPVLMRRVELSDAERAVADHSMVAAMRRR